ncbi:DDE family transposase [Tetrahymena thermophila SB210]|uniref:DDE family transposase n=1 Tax=Tetrahymena thermophila (strain SB210) TaxID=312017 RepID=A0A1B9C2A1_TETTS|nr:DDE family transposase [Tetrahymena thermophila SB210]
MEVQDFVNFTIYNLTQEINDNQREALKDVLRKNATSLTEQQLEIQSQTQFSPIDQVYPLLNLMDRANLPSQDCQCLLRRKAVPGFKIPLIGYIQSAEFNLSERYNFNQKSRRAFQFLVPKIKFLLYHYFLSITNGSENSGELISYKGELRNCVFIMDNAIIHRSVLIEKTILKQIPHLFLAPYSPQMNPIEKLWFIIKLRLSKKRIRDLNSLLREIFITSQSIDAETCSKIVRFSYLWFSSALIEWPFLEKPYPGNYMFYFSP